MTIREDEQKLSVGTVVNLYTIDATPIGGDLYRFVPGPRDHQQVTYQGHVYDPIPIEIEGISYGGEGPASRPTMTISRLDATFMAAVIQKDNLRGAHVSRLRTLDKYLDGAPAADSDRHWPKEVYFVERLARQSRNQVVWQLTNPIDIDKKKLPGRQILRDVCTWRYRHFTEGAFDYSHALCPYTGTQYFNDKDQPVNKPTEDVCSRRPSGCKLRYPGSPLPYGGFIGVSRMRH